MFELRFLANGKRESVVVHERADCECGCGGGWDERAARRELSNVLARVRVGIWKPDKARPREAPKQPETVPTFHEYASLWLDRRSDGVLGDRPLSANTRSDYLWRLRGHLLPFFGPRRLDEINAEMCLAFKAQKRRESRDLRASIAAGAEVRDEHNRRRVPLGPSSIRKLITCLAAILDDAIEDGHIERNPARSKRMRVRVPKPQRSFLELDELRALMDAAAAQDPNSGRVKARPGAGETGQRVAELLTRGMSQDAVAEALGRTKATVNWHARRMSVVGTPYTGRAFVARVLGYSGVRNSELCDLRIGHVRVHDPGGARFHIPDAKTETGVRIVEMSPDLAEAFVAHLDRLRRGGSATGLDDYVVQNLRGGRISRQRIAEIIREAATLASETRAQHGLPPLPRTTPHSLRRTYISIALLANRFDVKWVMSQVGHGDSKMTLDVYAQLEQRIKRDHGVQFDALVRSAEEQMHGEGMDPEPEHDDADPTADRDDESMDDSDAGRHRS
ncbi:MAG: tyrosine-type recombinase/integrase [Thermoanaerobaculia bacterium]